MNGPDTTANHPKNGGQAAQLQLQLVQERLERQQDRMRAEQQIQLMEERMARRSLKQGLQQEKKLLEERKNREISELKAAIAEAQPDLVEAARPPGP